MNEFIMCQKLETITCQTPPANKLL